MRQLIEITGLWEGRDKKGSLTLSGPLGGKGEIVIFKHYNKQNEAQPDFKLYLCMRNKRTPLIIEDDEFSLKGKEEGPQREEQQEEEDQIIIDPIELEPDDLPF